MADRATVVGLTLTSVGTAAAMIDRVLPPMHEVRSSPASAAATTQLRGEFLRTAAVVLAIGAGVATLAKSALPLVGVASVSGWLWWEYERAARTDLGPTLR
jgi:hypothetical protein